MASLGSTLQENLLMLLTYDKKHSSIIRGVVEPGLFSGLYREIAARVYDYIDRYKKPPGDHLPDLLVDKLEGVSTKEVNLYRDIVDSINEMHEGINVEYIMNQLETFVTRQTLRAAAIELTTALQKDTEDSLDEANDIIRKVNTSNLKVFEPGLRLSSPKALNFLDIEQDVFLTGIPELDARGFGPTRQELLLYISLAKRGKSWWLSHVAKMALMHQLRVCHVSLEMSEDRVAARYMMGLFAVGKRKEAKDTIRFVKDKLGRIEGFERVSMKPKIALADHDVRKKLEALSDKWRYRLLDNIIIKRFPTGRLTTRGLEAYLDGLEATERFVPDVLVLDYPDLMQLDTDKYRFSIDEIYKDLRGMAIVRNLALCVVSQSNRGGEKAKTVGSGNVAEAYTKVQHADAIVTYSQTSEEAKLGLARLHVAGGRNDEDKITIVISQNYSQGQFVVDSSIMAGRYWESVENDLKEGDYPVQDESP